MNQKKINKFTIKGFPFNIFNIIIEYVNNINSKTNNIDVQQNAIVINSPNNIAKIEINDDNIILQIGKLHKVVLNATKLDKLYNLLNS